MMESFWFIGIITNWEEKSRKNKFRPMEPSRENSPLDPDTRSGEP
jgi:hypothetical protein